MSLYSADVADGNPARDLAGNGMALAVRAADLTVPLRMASGGGERTGLVVAGTARIHSGDEVVWFVPVVATAAKVRRDGSVQAEGRACEHTSLGHAERVLDELTGLTGVIERIAASTTCRGRIKGVRRRSMNIATVIRAVLLMTLMPHAGYRQILDHLFGDLTRIPWQHSFKVPSPSTLHAWRTAVGARPLRVLLNKALAGTRAAHTDAIWAVFEAGGLLVGAIDGTVTRMKDTIANREVFGTATKDGPFPQIRHLHVTDAVTRSVLAMASGPSGGDKADAEQGLLDHVLDTRPGLFTPNRVWIMDRNYPGAERIKRLLATKTHILIRLKSDIRLDRVGDFLPDGSWIADIRGNDVTVRIRVIEYVVELDEQIRPESYCLITDLTDHAHWPAPMLADLYPRRWEGSETSIKENKSTIRGAGPATGAILRSATPEGIEQEHAAWTTGCEIVRAAIRDATCLAAPIGQGPRTGQAITTRDLSFTRTREILTANTRPIPGDPTCAMNAIAATRGQPDRHRHHDRVTKAAPTFPNRSAAPTRTQVAVVHTYDNTPTTDTGSEPGTTPAQATTGPGQTPPKTSDTKAEHHQKPTKTTHAPHANEPDTPSRRSRRHTHTRPRHRPRPPGQQRRTTPTRRPRALTTAAARTRN